MAKQSTPKIQLKAGRIKHEIKDINDERLYAKTCIRTTNKLWDEISTYRFKNRFLSVNDCLLHLIQIGLEQEKKDGRHN